MRFTFAIELSGYATQPDIAFRYLPAITPMPASINEVLHADLFQRLCVTSGVW
jgi:hypothetical protein